MKRILTVTFLTAGIAVAQSNQSLIGVPWLGWVFDAEAKAARPITGLAMSAMLGSKADVGLSSAVGSSEGSFALGVATENGKVLIVTGSGSTELVGAKVNPLKIAMSIQGQVAALYFEEVNTVQVFEGLPSSPRLVRELNIASAPIALAVDDAATVVLASDENGLYSYGAEQGKQLVLAGGSIASVGFFGGSKDVLAVNDGKVVMVRDGVPTTAEDSETDAVKATVSRDGKSLVALLKEGGVLVRDLATGTSRFLRCYCTPNDLGRMHGNAVFRLNGPEDGTMWLLNGDDEEPKLTFVATRGEN